MEDFILQNGPAALVTVLVLQALKEATGITWLQPGTMGKVYEWRNRAVSVIMAGLVTLGIHYGFHYDAHTQSYDIVISGTLVGLKTGLLAWVQQWAAQHTAYKTIVVLPELLGKLADRLLPPPQH